jgi:predicted GNAT family acetyltransferase
VEVQLLREPARFAEVAGAWLATEPLTGNVLGTSLEAALAGGPRGPQDVWLVLRDRDGLVGAALHTPPRAPFLPRLPPGAATALASALHRAGRPLPGVHGEAAAAREFAAAWTGLVGGTAELVVALRLHRLGTLVPPTGVPGAARLAGPADLPLLTAWFDAFHAEATPDRPAGGGTRPEERLASGQLWLWEVAGEPVALAGRTAVAAGVARVGPVYTPPGRRRRGYAAAVTAVAGAAGREAGAQEVVLYADLANPTSNGVYLRLGYLPDHEAVELRFTRPA